MLSSIQQAPPERLGPPPQSSQEALRAHHMTNKNRATSDNLVQKGSDSHCKLMVCGGYISRALIVAGVLLLVYGLAWTYSTRRYLKGFADAIIPLNGSAEQKSLALLEWLRHAPERAQTTQPEASPRDPVGVVHDARLLKVCGSASNAFINLGEAAGIKTRRLLLLDPAWDSRHVVVEAWWDDRWAVVDPSFRAVFRDRSGRPLSKEELRNPLVFQDAISRIPNYNREYTFDRTVHLHLTRIPLVGRFLRRSLDSWFPGWEEIENWGYLPEHPSLWPLVFSLPFVVLGILLRMAIRAYGRQRVGVKTFGFRKRLVESGRVFLQKSA